MAKQLRILTFNHHESFLNAMAPLGHHFDIVIKKGPLDLSWNTANRQPPENFRLIDFEEARAQLKKGGYDAVVAHTVKNLFWLFWINRVLTIFVAHIPLYWDRPTRIVKSLGKLATVWLYRLTHRFRFVAVSEWKRMTWGFSGPVVRFFPVPFPPDLLAPEKSKGVVPVVVGNAIAARGRELGWDLLGPLLREFPIRVLGRNPEIPVAVAPQTYAEFIRLFSSAHFYVYTIQQPEGDGYNTAMLEAMNIGLPVVTIANPSSPIVHGVNGLVAVTPAELRTHIRQLLLHPENLERLGQGARETVRSMFTEEAFLQAWREALS
ncbi:glycosyltransferase family 4 protein [Oligoflexus tunisiensis]|uniref:glycosyltransferase family 4 protein n=1 Tax=Oligoflexus tunisiensis TaxID=708132 RepID=UPI00114D3626|nr:glycosyltransferase family 4 protein [Oligoflexus tunisiensis]